MKLMTIVAFLALAECEFVGLCPSDPCMSDGTCPDDHVCVQGQCVLPCDSVAECPAGDGDRPRCIDPQGLAGRTICTDVDGVPGQRCEPELEV